MNNFLSMLKPDTRVNVGVSVSPNVGLEMILVDPVQHKIMKYAQRPLAYNPSTREIEDYGEFKTLLTDLFNELKIDPKNTNIILNMPSVCFGHTFLPTMLDDEGVTTALTSDIEQNYLFKKNVPVVSWVEVKTNNTTEKRYVLYSAIQEGVVEVLKQIFSDLGANLIAIENTYSSLIKTLEYTELTKEFAKTPGAWNILLVSQNSYAVFSLLDYNVIEYFEDPLAIKSFNNEEVYIAIAQAASSVLEKYASEKLLIISESNDVSAEILALQLKHPGDVIFLECNQYSKTPVMNVDLNVLPHYVKAITPEAIGAAVYRTKEFGLKLNFLSSNDVKAPDLINVMGIELTQEQLFIYTAIIGALIVGLGFFGSSALGTYISSMESQKASLEQEASSLQIELNSLQKDGNKIDIYSAAKNIDKSMVEKILYYNAIGADIPSKVWLTDFYADTRGAYGIEGETVSVDDVYLFFRNIKAQVPNSNLILSKLSVDDNDGMIDIENTANANYKFALSNSGYSSAKAAKTTDTNDGQTNPDGQQQPNQENPAPQQEGTNVPNLPSLPGT